jgi:cytochrome P450
MKPTAHLYPPGPPAAWTGFFVLRSCQRDYLGHLQNLHRTYGDIVHMRIAHEHVYDLFTPDLVRQALVDNAAHLTRWERGTKVFADLFGQSVLTTSGDTWQRQRRMLQPAFAPKQVAGYARLMVDAASKVLDTAVPLGQAQALVPMDALFSRMAIDVILRTLFSHGTTAQESLQVAAATQTLGDTAMSEMFWPITLPDFLPLPGKAAKRQALRTLRQLVGHHVQQRNAQTQPQGAGDLLDSLLALRDEATGKPLDAAEVFDQCMVSFQAGYETSATALLWWSRLMAEHPEAMRHVQTEVDQVLQGRPPGPDDLPALPWLTATLKEAMRLYPPIAGLMSRRTLRSIRLGDWDIPKRAVLRITPWVLQRDARSFAQPDAFCPERFMPGAPPIPRGAWIPFGIGPHVCIGQHFAMLEMTLLAAMLLQRYRLVLPPDAPPCVPVLRVTLRPRDGVALLLQRR